LGILYLIKKDMPTAFKWFTKAADQGYTYAQSALKKYF
jgi:TPR repeat protein